MKVLSSFVLALPLILFAESEFFYDASSNLVKKQLQNGAYVAWEYDRCNRPVTISASEAHSVNLKYDAAGNCIEILDEQGVTKFLYDSLNRLAAIAHPFLGIIGYSYDPRGQLNTILYPNGSIVRYVYDSSNRLSHLICPQGIVRYAYHSASNTLTQIILPNGSTTDFTYDFSRRVASIAHKRSNGKLIQAFYYEYDSKGNITKTVRGDSSQKNSIVYSYDKLDRLVAVESSSGIEKFSYDPFGNRLSRETSSGIEIYQYDNNRLIQAGDIKFEYDENGNLIKKIAPRKTAIYIYDSKDNLVEYRDGKNIVKYRYDAVGRRVAKTFNNKTTFYVNHILTSSTQVLLELDEEKKVQAEYIYGLGRVMGTLNGVPSFYLTDNLDGNVAAILDKNQTVKAFYEYDSFGFPQTDSSFLSDRFLFAAEDYEAETGLIYLRNRYYDPEIGRFISPDPVFGDIANPQALNPYVYANNNPVNFRDPLGLESATAVVYPPGAVNEDGVRSRVGHGFWILKKDDGSFLSPGRYPGGAHFDDVIFQGAVSYTWPASDVQIDQIFTDVCKGGYWGVFGNCIDGIERGLKVLEVSHPNFNVLGISCPNKAIMWMESLNNRSEYTDAIQKWKNFIWDPDHQSLPGPIWVPPVHDPRIRSSSLPAQEADLGGVSLNQAAQFVGSIANILGAVYDSDSGQIILLGESNKALPPMDFDDLAVAIRAIYGLGGAASESPGISIDWNEENTKKLKKEKYDHLSPMPVSYRGSIDNTRFGQILFEADRLLKCLILGRDNISGSVFSAPVSGYHSLPFLYANSRTHFQPGAMTRMWLVPKEVSLVESQDGSAMAFSKAEIEVMTENKFRGRVIDDPIAEGFARHFTSHFDEFAEYYPVLQDLKRLAKVSAVVKWIKQNNIPFDLSIFKNYEPLSFATPSHTPATFCPSFAGGRSLITVGGVTFHFDENNFHRIKSETVESLKEMTAFQRPNNDTLIWDFADRDSGRILTAVAQPLYKTRKVGNVKKWFLDMHFQVPGELPFSLVRTYNSFSDDESSMGIGWSIANHQLSFPFSKVNYFYAEARHVLNLYPEIYVLERGYQLRYKPIGADAEMLPIYGTDGSEGLLKELEDGSFIMIKERKILVAFNKRGDVLSESDGKYAKIDYRYEKDRLSAISHSCGLEIQFEYKDDRLVKVTGPGKKSIEYSYMENGQLAEVHDSQGIIASFSYDSDKNLIEILNGAGVAFFEASYDLYHRAISLQENGVSSVNSYNLKNRTMETITGTLTTNNQFDSSYKLTECVDSFNRKIKLSYDPLSGKVSSLNDSSGNEYINQYDQKGRLIKTINPEGSLKRFWYCSNGRLGAILDALGKGTVYQYDAQGHITKIAEGASLVNDDVDEWEFTCPEIFISEFTYDPVTGFLKSVSKAGQLIREFSFDDRGQLKSSIDPYGYTVSRVYDDRGRLVKIRDSQNELVTYSYNERDLPVEILFASGKVLYAYDNAGRISRITDANGCVSFFKYDDRGDLVEVKDAESGVTRYEYNDSHKLIRVVFPNRTEKEFSYDFLNRISSSK
jgi:RHS repeat-associated protein